MLDRLVLALAAPVCLLTVASFCFGAPTREQRQQVSPIARLMTKAANLYRQKKYSESVQAFREVQVMLGEVVPEANGDMLQLLRPIHDRLRNTHPLLEIEGYKLPPIIPLSDPSSPIPTANGISFVNQVSPILVSKCGRCHVSRASGMFSMESYAVLMRGPTAGKVVFPEDAIGSRMIEVIEEGDMPRGGGQVSPQELMTLKNWIVEGAKFDGPDPAANLASLTPESMPARSQRLEVTIATGSEQVSFARDIAPVLVERCSGCHVNPPQRAEGQLNMSTFQQLLRGGESGNIVSPGMPDSSLLIGKLSGTAGRRMPPGGDPLAPDVLAKFKTWIAEGAKYDGADAGRQVRRVAALAQAAASTHQQLSENREQKSNEYWRLSMPNISPIQSETDDFLLLGNIGEDEIQHYAEKAEELVPQIARIFRANSNQPFVKGRMTIFFFRQRYDYSEFGKMVEERQLPGDFSSHWRYNVTDAYAAIVAAPEKDEGIDAELAAHIASLHIASLAADVPNWFAEGCGRVAVSRLGIDSTLVAAWERQINSIARGMNRAEDFLNDRLPREDNDIVSFGFVKFLMSDSRRFTRLLNALRQGTAFDQAFAANYGRNTVQVAQFWRNSDR